jgi:hypothetical protein
LSLMGLGFQLKGFALVKLVLHLFSHTSNPKN